MRRHPVTRTTPVVLLTALAEVSDRVKGLRGGADDYQVKPFEPEELLARVEGLIARSQGRSEIFIPPEDQETLEDVVAEIDRRITADRTLDDLHLGRYEVRQVLGRGAMGTVLEGWDPKLMRPVALKTLRLNTKSVKRNRERQVSLLLREAVANARVNHPNIVTVYDVADEGMAAFIAMEMVEGESLDDRLERYGKLPHPYVIILGAAIARALDAAHAKDIVHRDIKPANVLLANNDSIKVTDFGIAEFISRSATNGSIFGTPGYLAPETLSESSITGSCDLFSLGVSLYECLTGIHPFADENWRQTLTNALKSDPQPLSELAEDLPPALVELVEALLEKDPANRPADAQQVLNQLEDLSHAEYTAWSETFPKVDRRLRVGTTTHSRLITLNTMAKTDSFSAASLEI